MSRSPATAARRLAVALVCAVAALLAAPGAASALPTAEFTFTPATAFAGEPVTFTFTGSCDAPPCTINWRWFRSGGSTLGTVMGSGQTVTYAFPTGGSYSVVAKITNSLSTHGSASATHTVTVQDLPEDDRHIRYDGWRGVVDPGATTGGYRMASTTDSVASATFTGTSVTYVGRTGRDKGIVLLSVPGSTSRRVDLYSPSPGTVEVPLTGLADGTHTIRVRPTGTSNAAATGTAVDLDELVVGGTRLDDRSPAIAYTRWQGAQESRARGGSLRRSSARGASASFTFTGPSVTWISARGPAQGIAQVLIDGQPVERVDAYAASRAWQVAHTYGGLTDQRHVVRVVVQGRHSASSTGDAVICDGFVQG